MSRRADPPGAHGARPLCLALTLIFGLFAPSGCRRAPPPSSAPPPSRTAPAPAERRLPHYTRHVLLGQKDLNALRRSLGEERFELLLMVNRRDLAHFLAHDTLVVPDAEAKPLDCSPFPPGIDAARAAPKLLLVSVAVQAFGAYQAGRLVRWGPVSTGRRDLPTPPGCYHANWKSEQRRSTVNDEWLLNWVVNIENLEGISLHEYELPGYPASHSCVRLLEPDARWLYDWVDTWTLAADRRHILRPGTPVVVFGSWRWGKPAPWRALPDEARATTLADDTLRDAIAPLLTEIR